MRRFFNSRRKLRSARQTPTANPGDMTTNQRSLLQALKANKTAPGVRQMSAQQAQAMKMANTKGPVQQARKAPAGAANQGVRQMSAQQAQQLKASNTSRANTGMAKGGMVKDKAKAMPKKKGMK